MAPEQKKRPRPAPNAIQKSKKRQKIVPAKKEAVAVTKRPVAVDALPWNEVQMPDMFDDAEGFFGLEEVEGVEIIRDGGTVKFVCAICFIVNRKLTICRCLLKCQPWTTMRSSKVLEMTRS